jgi:hypothetical protein
VEVLQRSARERATHWRAPTRPSRSGNGLSEFGTWAFGPGTGTVGTPEPGNLALLFLGVAGVGFIRQRRKKLTAVHD